MPVDGTTRDLLRLTLTPGLGPVLITRLLHTFGSAPQALAASPRELERVPRIGRAKSVAIARGFKDSSRLADEELQLAEKLDVRIIPQHDPEYPPLLKQIHDAPPLLYIRGRLSPADLDRYPVALVGSRRATAYGIEQAERFAGILARSGLTIVSGGARGIDTAAHRGAMRSGGRTVAVLGCGLANCYPPENAELFDRIVEQGNGHDGAVISELPLRAPPESDNFPARNRLISGMCLGVIVIEAGRKSGSLITARMAVADHNREVMAVPGRVDSPASVGTHELLKEGAAALVTDPADVLAILETPARHHFDGTHVHRYAAESPVETAADADSPGPASTGDSLFAPGAAMPVATAPITGGLPLTPTQKGILAALVEPLTVDEIVAATGLSPAMLRSEVTLLEIQGRIVRKGSRLARS